MGRLREHAQRRARELKAEADDARLALTDAVEKHMPEPDAISGWSTRFSAVGRSLAELWDKAVAKANSLLTPQQRERLERAAHGDLRRDPATPLAAAPKAPK